MEKILLKNLDWLREKLEKQSKKRIESIFEPGKVFVTDTLNLSFHQYQKPHLTAKMESGNIMLYYNSGNTNFTDERIQEFIKKFILKCLQNEGCKYLPQRLTLLSEKTGLKFRTVKIGIAGTRLGSCNSRNDITLSARLMLLPPFLIDYVILHELCHIVYKNHSEKFHSLLNQLTGNKSTELNKMLKKHRVEIIPGVYKYDHFQ